MSSLEIKQEVKALLPNSATIHMLMSNGEHKFSKSNMYWRHKKLIIIEQLR